MHTIRSAKKKYLMDLDGVPYYVYDCSTGSEKVYEEDKKPKKKKKKNENSTAKISFSR